MQRLSAIHLYIQVIMVHLDYRLKNNRLHKYLIRTSPRWPAKAPSTYSSVFASCQKNKKNSLTATSEKYDSENEILLVVAQLR